MKVAFIDYNPSPATRALIDTCNGIITEYQAQNLRLTLRQLYYQLVARDIIPNSQREYKRVGAHVKNARDAGLIDWDAIEDRTRQLRGNTHWSSPQQIVKAAIQSYRTDTRGTQPYRPEIWIEKDALAGVIAPTCADLDVNYFVCRGYTSASEMFDTGYRRFRTYLKEGQKPVVIHLGDHDPSGIDMTRDIRERLALYAGLSTNDLHVIRIALNWEQIETYNPPPNFAKTTDSRAGEYIKRHGRQSWELDALDPVVLRNLIVSEVDKWTDDDLLEDALSKQEEGRQWLKNAIGASQYGAGWQP